MAIRGGHRLLELGRRWGPVLLLALLCRFVLLLLSAFAHVVNTGEGLGSYHQLLEIWNRWDAPHYLFIAEHGYVSQGDEANFIVFLPFYPILTRLAAMIVGDYLLGGMVVSFIASLAAAVLLYELALLDLDRATALRAIWFMSIFPTAYFFIAPYTEALCLALALAAFYAARTSRYAWAGLWGGLAVFTRGMAGALLPALLLEFPWQRLRPRPAALWLGFLPLAGLLYLGINYAVFGDPFAFKERLEEHWFKQLSWPWEGLYNTFLAYTWRSPGEAMLVVWGELVSVAIVLAAGLAALRWLRPSYAIYVLASWLIMTSTAYILSTPRYALLLFPLFILMARLARRELWGYGLSALSLAFLAFFTVLYTSGRWAF